MGRGVYGSACFPTSTAAAGSTWNVTLSAAAPQSPATTLTPASDVHFQSSRTHQMMSLSLCALLPAANNRVPVIQRQLGFPPLGAAEMRCQSPRSWREAGLASPMPPGGTALAATLPRRALQCPCLSGQVTGAQCQGCADDSQLERVRPGGLGALQLPTSRGRGPDALKPHFQVTQKNTQGIRQATKFPRQHGGTNSGRFSRPPCLSPTKARPWVRGELISLLLTGKMMENI